MDIATAQLGTAGQAWFNDAKNPNNASFKDYGAKGIDVCERWLVFANFLEDMGPRPEGAYSIERVDNSKGYSLDNCKWATAKEQARNRKTNRMVTFGQETMCIAEWCDRFNINPLAVHRKVHRGMSPEEAIMSLRI